VNLCCRSLLSAIAGCISCSCALRVRAAPLRLLAPSRPTINRRGSCRNTFWVAFWMLHWRPRNRAAHGGENNRTDSRFSGLLERLIAFRRKPAIGLQPSHLTIGIGIAVSPAGEKTSWKLGLVLARNASSLYGPSAPVKVVPPSPAASTLTVLAGPGDFALRISRREFCQEQETDRRRTNADGNGLTIPRNDA
jgi:hypothetical protein